MIFVWADRRQIIVADIRSDVQFKQTVGPMRLIAADRNNNRSGQTITVNCSGYPQVWAAQANRGTAAFDSDRQQ